MGVSPSFETMKPQLCFFLKNPFLFNNIEFKIGKGSYIFAEYN